MDRAGRDGIHPCSSICHQTKNLGGKGGRFREKKKPEYSINKNTGGKEKEGVNLIGGCLHGKGTNFVLGRV